MDRRLKIKSFYFTDAIKSLNKPKSFLERKQTMQEALLQPYGNPGKH